MAWDLRTQDGIVIRNIPDDVPQDHQSLRERVTRIRSGQADMQRMADPTAGMGGMEKFNAGMGKAFTDVGRGVSQLVGGGPSAEEVRETRQQDAPLMRSGAGAAGNIAGNVAAFAPLAMVPGANAVAGAGALGAVTGGLQPVEDTGDRLKNMATGGALGAGMQALAGPIAQRLGEWGANRQAQAAAQQSQNAYRDETLRMGRDAGLVVPPSAVNPSATNRLVESVGGKAAVGQEAVERNAPVLDAMGRRAAGLDPNAPLSRENLRGARQNMAAPYREIASISPQASQDLAALQQARFDSKMAWREYNRQGARTAYNDAQAADQRVAQLTSSIEQQAQAANRPDLVQALVQARQKIARNRQVQEAVNVGSGHLDPAVVGRALDRGAPLEGDLLTIGRMQQNYPKFLKDVSGEQAAGTNNLHAWLAATGAGIGGHLAGPAGAVAGASLPYVAPPIARNAALSKIYGRMMGTPNYSAGMAANSAAALENPETRQRIALLARALALPAAATPSN